MLQRYLRDCVSLVSNDSDSECNYNVYNGGKPFEDSAESCNVVHYQKKEGKSSVFAVKRQATMDSLQFYYLYGSCSEASVDDERRQREKIANTKHQKQKKEKKQVRRQNSRSKLSNKSKDENKLGNYQDKKQQQLLEKVASARYVGDRVSKVEGGVQGRGTLERANSKNSKNSNDKTGRKAVGRSMSYNVGRTSGYELLKKRYFKCGDTRKKLQNNLERDNAVGTIAEPSQGEEEAVAPLQQRNKTLPTPLIISPRDSVSVHSPQVSCQEFQKNPNIPSIQEDTAQQQTQLQKQEEDKTNLESPKSTPNIQSRDTAEQEYKESQNNNNNNNNNRSQQQKQQQQQVVKEDDEKLLASFSKKLDLKKYVQQQSSVKSASPRTPIAKVEKEVMSSVESKRTSEFDSVAPKIEDKLENNQNLVDSEKVEDLKIQENQSSQETSKKGPTIAPKISDEPNKNQNLQDSQKVQEPKVEEKQPQQQTLRSGPSQETSKNNVASRISSFASQQQKSFDSTKMAPKKVVTKIHTAADVQVEGGDEGGVAAKPSTQISKAAQNFSNKTKISEKTGNFENLKSTPSRMSPQSPLNSQEFMARAATFTERKVQPSQPQISQPQPECKSKGGKLANLIARFESAN